MLIIESKNNKLYHMLIYLKNKNEKELELYKIRY